MNKDNLIKYLNHDISYAKYKEGKTQKFNDFEQFCINHCLDIEELLKENEELKKQLEIKNDGFMASINETCEYATILEEFEKWLEEESSNVANDEIYNFALRYCLKKLQELKESKE